MDFGGHLRSGKEMGEGMSIVQGKEKFFHERTFGNFINVDNHWNSSMNTRGRFCPGLKLWR